MAAAQLSFWNAAPMVWNDVRLPDAFYAYYKAHSACPNCRLPLRHPLHALNHYKKFHRVSTVHFFMWKFGMWHEISQKAYHRARGRGVATARTK